MEEQNDVFSWGQHTFQRIAELKKSERKEEREVARLTDLIARLAVSCVFDIASIEVKSETEPDNPEAVLPKRARENILGYLNALVANVNLAITETEEYKAARALYRSILYAERETLSDMITQYVKKGEEGKEDEIQIYLYSAYTAIRTFALYASKLPTDKAESLWAIYSNDIEWTRFPGWEDAERQTEGFFSDLFKDEKDSATLVSKSRGTVANAEQLRSITVRKMEGILFPLDKINSTIWGLQGMNGSRQEVPIAVESHKDKAKGQQITVSVVLDFSAVTDGLVSDILLSQFDRRVHNAALTLYNAGYECMTLTQIYNAMGNRTRPNGRTLQRIQDSLTKMRHGTICINNSEEAKASGGKYKYPLYIYDGVILPYERETVIVNGKIAEAAIRLFREPPLGTFGRERKQITTLPAQILQSPLSQTEENLGIEDYILRRISQAKNAKSKEVRILYKTIAENCSIESEKQRARLPEKVARLLEHYKKGKFISGFYTMKEKDEKNKKARGVCVSI